MITTDPDSPDSFFVSSMTVIGKKYNVFYDWRKQIFRCECTYWSLFQKDCNHIKRVGARISRKYMLINKDVES